MAGSSGLKVLAEQRPKGPAPADLDKCVHCGLCLNACPTYRELGVEMDSPRGRIYQMNEIVRGAAITPAHILHFDLCLACRGCETACPSGVPYGRMIEAMRAGLEAERDRSFLAGVLRRFIFERLLPSRTVLQTAGAALYVYDVSGLRAFVRASGVLKLFGKLSNLEALSPRAEVPFFYSKFGKTFPAIGPRRYRVALVAGCIANIAFSRLNEATIRVLQQNGCEIVVPGNQGCCGALHLHSGLNEQARALARKNVNAIAANEFDAIVTNAAGCGSTLKEYDELLRDDRHYAEKAIQFRNRMKDITEFLASIDLKAPTGSVQEVVTYQDSCHLAHGQRIKNAPRKLLKAIPGLTFREMPMADLCCGSAGVYNVVQNGMAMQILEHKMQYIDMTGASIIATANPGCLLQLAAGARLYGKGQRVAHVVEILDEAYRNENGANPASAS